jgi:hypothetical protein
MVDGGFGSVGIDTLSQQWPVFAAVAAFEAWLVRRIRRSRRFPVQWIAAAALAAACLAAVLWFESLLATRLASQTIAEGLPARPWTDLLAHVQRSWPLLAGVGVAVLGLVWHPRSEAAMTGLVAAAGVLVSWNVTMWLFVTHHGAAMFHLRILPGGLGVVASLVGVPASLALWMAVGRWIWGEGRRRRRRQRPRGSDAATR